MNNPNIHNRRSIRLKNYDYSGAGLYFITLCTVDRKNIFGEIINGEMHYNAFGAIANEEWENTPEIRKNISLGEYIIMPNHFHAIISIDYRIRKPDTNVLQYAPNETQASFHSPSQTIGAIIRGYKGATTKRINNLIRETRKNKGESTGVLQYAPTSASAKAPTSAPTKNSSLTGEGSIWQRNYYEHIIKSDKAYNNISNYIINNPLNWDKDKFK
jgi:REP element-mobilizing transposase RayT